jgi:hypothetical protein
MPNANRYWVGGTGTWGSTQTTKWSATSGISFTGSRTGTALTTVGSPALVVGMTLFNNAGTASGTISSGSGNSWVTSASGTLSSQNMSAATIGASVPDSTDDVFFDANSNLGANVFTITMANTPRVCNNLTISGLDGTMTLAGTSIGLTVSGSLLFPLTSFNRTYSGTTTFAATTTGKTITTNGKTLTGGVTFSGSGGGWTLGSALDCGSGTISHLYGTFDTGSYAVTAGSLFSNSGLTRTLNLNNSTIILSATSSALELSSGNLTFNAGTSSITLTNATIFNNSAAVTFYDLTINSATTVSFNNGAHTFNQLSINANNTNTTFSSSNTINILRSINSSSNISNFIFNANQTINKFQFGTTVGSCSRIMLRSNSIGTQRSIAMTTGSSINEVDFRDIAITGTTLSGSRLGDCKGNSGITFPAAKTVYYAQTVLANWGDVNSWSATSGGVADPDYFPLAQDTAIFPAAYPVNAQLVNINANYNIGTIDMSARTSNQLQIRILTDVSIYGDWTNGTQTYIFPTAYSVTFAGRQTQTLTSAGITFDANFNISNINTIFCIVGNLTVTSKTIYLMNGTLNLNGYTAECSGFDSSGSTSNLTFNGGTLKFNSNFNVTGILTTTQGSAAGKIVVGNLSGYPTFTGGGATYNCTLEIAYTGPTSINGSNTFTNITNSVTPCTLSFEYNTTNTFLNWNVNGTAGNLVTLNSSDGSASFSLSKASGIVSSDYLDIRVSDAIGGAAWYAGTHSIKDVATSGWILTAPPATGNFFLLFFQ